MLHQLSATCLFHTRHGKLRQAQAAVAAPTVSQMSPQHTSQCRAALRGGVPSSVCRLTDDEDRSWLIATLRDTIKAHFSLKLDDLVRHLAPSSRAEVGPEEMRGLLFGGYLDATADSLAERMYAEARVCVPCPSFAYVCFCIVFRWA